MFWENMLPPLLEEKNETAGSPKYSQPCTDLCGVTPQRRKALIYKIILTVSKY
jgi:hypothetical protein